MDTQTIEGNKLIADFMGHVRKDRPIHSAGWKHWHIEPFGYFEDEELLYHSSWDWLMPVVEKIEDMGYYTNILKDEDLHIVTIHKPTHSYKRTDEDMIICTDPGKHDKKINAVLDAVIQFIQWYNTTKPLTP